MLGSISEAVEVGNQYTSFEVDGKVYRALIPNKDAKREFYEAKQAMRGDSVARELLLGGQDKKYIFIGDLEAPCWLVITKDDEYVIDYHKEKQ